MISIRSDDKIDDKIMIKSFKKKFMTKQQNLNEY